MMRFVYLCWRNDEVLLLFFIEEETMHLFFCQQEQCQYDYSGSKPACLTMSTKRNNVVPHYLSRKKSSATLWLEKKIRTFFQEIMLLMCVLSLKKKINNNNAGKNELLPRACVPNFFNKKSKYFCGPRPLRAWLTALLLGAGWGPRASRPGLASWDGPVLNPRRANSARPIHV